MNFPSCVCFCLKNLIPLTPWWIFQGVSVFALKLWFLWLPNEFSLLCLFLPQNLDSFDSLSIFRCTSVFRHETLIPLTPYQFSGVPLFFPLKLWFLWFPDEFTLVCLFSPWNFDSFDSLMNFPRCVSFCLKTLIPLTPWWIFQGVSVFASKPWFLWLPDEFS